MILLGPSSLYQELDFSVVSFGFDRIVFVYVCVSDELPYIQLPLHTVVKLSPVAYGCIADFISLDIPAVDTYRPIPPVRLIASRYTLIIMQLTTAFVTRRMFTSRVVMHFFLIVDFCCITLHDYTGILLCCISNVILYDVVNCTWGTVP